MAKWGELKCPNCEETFQMYVDANEARIDAEKKLRKSALQEMSALGQASEAYQAQKEAEAKLEKAVEAMQFWSEAVEPDIDKAIALMTSTLAELNYDERSEKKGQGDE